MGLYLGPVSDSHSNLLGSPEERGETMGICFHNAGKCNVLAGTNFDEEVVLNRLGTQSEKKRDYVGKIPKWRTPPHSVWETPVIKKKTWVYFYRTRVRSLGMLVSN